MKNIILLKSRIKEELKSKRYLDTIIHCCVGLLIYSISSIYLKTQKEILMFFSLFGSFFPDIDHIFLYNKKKFGSFKIFLRWIMKSERYRIGFELFHNAPVMLIILISLPYTYFKSKASFIFFLAFLLHLLVDLVLDKIIVGKIKWWRFGF